MFFDFGLLGIVISRPNKRDDPTNSEASDVVEGERSEPEQRHPNEWF
jgi:hypothetical protein